ncbi:MerR family transcriptional regulator [Macrococcus lamae]|uniref:MerR family transcriptional regulator n=1 Tax=Macrococcus lamae TaxID=198484 RepID=A0A4R6BT97_9STAP|nr:TipAS antibiotic-recognition domain-containing protein [Macrococcus lamae]TDM07871.1 MerR family transcriptional regulator [Macrococcus lamae]
MWINEVSELTGLTKRTLRYYDTLGLVSPEADESGYRNYSDEDLERLYRVMLYKGLGLSLERIKESLDEELSLELLQGQLQHLEKERNRVDEQINLLKAAIISKEEKHMTNRKFEQFKQQQIDFNEQHYGEEIRNQYGESAVEAANAKFNGLTEDEYNDASAIDAQLKKLLTEAVHTKALPSDKIGADIAELHKAWLNYYWPKYNREMHLGLMMTYEADTRFKDYYNVTTGAADYLIEAIKCHI